MKLKASNAFSLIHQYIDGWRENNIHKITDILNKDIIIIESHGPKYIGIDSVKKWFDLWIKAKSRIIKWDILEIDFCKENQIAFCEWDFECISSDQKYSFKGISKFKLSNLKISYIHEYRMNKAEYNWDELKLNSE